MAAVGDWTSAFADTAAVQGLPDRIRDEVALSDTDIIILGAGIAGASLAAKLAGHAAVVVIEAEGAPGRHSTGRSAAMFFETYGGDTIRALTRASRNFLLAPPDEFATTPLMERCDALYVASHEQMATLEAFANEPTVAPVARLVSTSEALARVPILNPDAVAAGLVDSSGFSMDVDALLQGYLRQARRGGVVLHTDCGFGSEIIREANGWRVRSALGEWSAPVLVNATGAWADQTAVTAGVKTINIVPRRRTAVTINAPPALSVGDWPMVIDIDEAFYFKADAGQILISPADETASAPCDAAPEELDCAIAVDRFERVTTMQVTRINHRWAGLRSFVADRTPVAGWAPESPGFYWLAGQGGYGIQTSPAMAEFAAAQILGNRIPDNLAEEGVHAASLSPARPLPASPPVM